MILTFNNLETLLKSIINFVFIYQNNNHFFGGYDENSKKYLKIRKNKIPVLKNIKFFFNFF